MIEAERKLYEPHNDHCTLIQCVMDSMTGRHFRFMLALGDRLPHINHTQVPCSEWHPLLYRLLLGTRCSSLYHSQELDRTHWHLWCPTLYHIWFPTHRWLALQLVPSRAQDLHVCGMPMCKERKKKVFGNINIGPQSQVDPWYNVVESSRVMVECSRVK